MKKRNLHIGCIYRHFKGKRVLVVGTAHHTETGDELVIYREPGDPTKVVTWARPIDMFMSTVDKTKYPDVMQFYRFEEET